MEPPTIPLIEILICVIFTSVVVCLSYGIIVEQEVPLDTVEKKKEVIHVI